MALHSVKDPSIEAGAIWIRRRSENLVRRIEVIELLPCVLHRVEEFVDAREKGTVLYVAIQSPFEQPKGKTLAFLPIDTNRSSVEIAPPKDLSIFGQEGREFPLV